MQHDKHGNNNNGRQGVKRAVCSMDVVLFANDGRCKHIVMRSGQRPCWSAVQLVDSGKLDNNKHRMTRPGYAALLPSEEELTRRQAHERN